MSCSRPIFVRPKIAAEHRLDAQGDEGVVRDERTVDSLRREFARGAGEVKFIFANARDLVTLKAAVAEQAPRYGDIKAPTTVISGEIDKTVSTGIHSRPFVAAVPGAKLIVLPGVGHMVQNAAPELVASEIEAMISQLRHRTAATVGQEAD